MTVPPGEIMFKAEAVEIGHEYIRKLHRLLANLYLHVCPLPGSDAVVTTICENLPRVNHNGLMSLVHIFVMLMAETPQFRRTAKASMHFKSYSLSMAFSAGDEFEKAQCPMVAFVTFVIEQDKGLSHEIVVHLTDFVHGVILYNDVRPDRVEAISDLLTAVDDFYFDLSEGKHSRPACVECMSEDAFVARVYHCFGVMEGKSMLERENTDEASEANIVKSLAELLIACPGDDADDEDADVDDADVDDEVEIVSSSVSHDDDLKFCDNDENL